jgi:hypothetical protein
VRNKEEREMIMQSDIKCYGCGHFFTNGFGTHGCCKQEMEYLYKEVANVYSRCPLKKESEPANDIGCMTCEFCYKILSYNKVGCGKQTVIYDTQNEMYKNCPLKKEPPTVTYTPYYTQQEPANDIRDTAEWKPDYQEMYLSKVIQVCSLKTENAQLKQLIETRNYDIYREERNVKQLQTRLEEVGNSYELKLSQNTRLIEENAKLKAENERLKEHLALKGIYYYDGNFYQKSPRVNFTKAVTSTDQNEWKQVVAKPDKILLDLTKDQYNSFMDLLNWGKDKYVDTNLHELIDKLEKEIK